MKIAKLDDIVAQIAEIFASVHVNDSGVLREAKRSRAQANASSEFIQDAQPELQSKFSSSENLKSLFRKTAKRIHPDLAIDENDRIRRTNLMIEVNEAYKAGDGRRIQQILKQWEDSPESVIGDDIGARLIRTIRQIAQIQERISNLDIEMQQLTATSIYRLKTKVESQNKDVIFALEEMAAALDEQIYEQQKRLNKLVDIYINKK